ncbi:RNA polymerase-binding protein RbpA [Saccharopolyspora sp. ASAGF58]|uniref:RNA polymerase-binding protein RbpA n=1 Tax=Saccharopolyspora sp. ASAGF58 TaxID=2719023 RepID=UPI001FF08C50|nr:RNA polymerase-binding protein RbpA [Saccharopolyspora sp. ASAGF58]
MTGNRGYHTSLSRPGDQGAAPCRTVQYSCPQSHKFAVPFSGDADVPPTWECRMHGTASKRIDGSEPEQKKAKPPRTHWDVLLERRTIPELDELLHQRLAALRGKKTRSTSAPRGRP